jgi:hypothetical protein
MFEQRKADEMSHTLSIDRVDTTTTSVDVEGIDQSNLILLSNSTDPKTGATISRYTLADGDPQYPTYVDIKNQVDPRDAEGIRRTSITLRTWSRDLDSVSGLEVIKPISVVIAMNLPAMNLEVADVDQLLANAYSLTYGTVTMGARSVDLLNQLIFGLTQLY